MMSKRQLLIRTAMTVAVLLIGVLLLTLLEQWF